MYINIYILDFNAFQISAYLGLRSLDDMTSYNFDVVNWESEVLLLGIILLVSTKHGSMKIF